MDTLPAFALHRPRSLAEAVSALAQPGARPLGGGTDLIVNLRRGLGAPPALVDLTGIAELQQITGGESGLAIGAAVRIADLAEHPWVRQHFSAVAEAAAAIAGPTQRLMGTVGGNLCLDTRCLYYNQSEWWREANAHCLKTTGSQCHVAPGSRGVCFATYSGDLAPALLVHGAVLELIGPAGARRLPLAGFFTGRARHGDPPCSGDGRYFLALHPGEIIAAVQIPPAPGVVSGYDKLRVRRSIDYPVAGAAVALRREGEVLASLQVAITGTNPRPVLLEGTGALCGARPGEALWAGLEALVREQVMSMKTSFVAGMYRRRVAGVLARRLVARLFDPVSPDRTPARSAGAAGP
jgi:4-hydroxybenzoyl-CoA reductase subunit beta